MTCKTMISILLSVLLSLQFNTTLSMHIQTVSKHDESNENRRYVCLQPLTALLHHRHTNMQTNGSDYSIQERRNVALVNT